MDFVQRNISQKISKDLKISPVNSKYFKMFTNISKYLKEFSWEHF
jgi:hypothetical protein